ncbi:MAG: DUF6114 domain-containing protein [Nocardiaceae bacterium]|nr:DUF6114 domain-containing protein [Nocardiaceae bacterium]
MFTRFREFRWTRPFWGGLCVLVAGFNTLVFALPFNPVTAIVHAGLGAIGGILIGLIELFLGLVIWFRQQHKNVAGVIAVIVGLVSFPVTNLGGFVTGMLLAVIGGSWAFGWTLPKGRVSDEDLAPTEVPA